MNRSGRAATLALIGVGVLCVAWDGQRPAGGVRQLMPGGSDAAARATADALIRLVRDEPLGQPWADGAGRDSAACRQFLGNGFRCGPFEYWVYAWAGRFETGRLNRCAYLMGDSDSPTEERLTWELPKDGETSREAIESTWNAMVRAFDRAFDQLTPGRDSVMTSGSAYWAETKLYATRRGMVRIHRIAQKHEIMSPASIALEYWSTPLCAESLSSWIKDGPLFELMCECPSPYSGAIEGRTRDALRPRFESLSQALAKKPGDVADLPIVTAALRSATAAPATEDRDLILWSTHLWLRSLSDSTRDALEQKEALDDLLGASWNECMNDSLAYRLAARTGASRWTDAAFVELMTRGWGCLGGEGVDVPDTSDSWVDTSAPVIEHGERYLAGHRGSPIWNEVAWRTAMAHETAWTLFKSCEPYLRSLRAVGEKATVARGHRDRAIELYQVLVKGDPTSRRSQAAEKRLRRMRLDVATDFRMYCDFLD